jgi:hypothetical protein
MGGFFFSSCYPFDEPVVLGGASGVCFVEQRAYLGCVSRGCPGIRRRTASAFFTRASRTPGLPTPQSTEYYRRRKRSACLAGAARKAWGNGTHLIPKQLGEVLRTCYTSLTEHDGRGTDERNYLLSEGEERAIMKRGENVVFKRLGNAGRANAAMAQYGISQQQMRGYLGVMCPVDKVAACSTALWNAGSAVDEVTAKLFKQHASEDGKCHYVHVGDMLSLLAPEYFVKICKALVNPRAQRFFLPEQLPPPPPPPAPSPSTAGDGHNASTCSGGACCSSNLLAGRPRAPPPPPTQVSDSPTAEAEERGTKRPATVSRDGQVRTRLPYVRRPPFDGVLPSSLAVPVQRGGSQPPADLSLNKRKPRSPLTVHWVCAFQEQAPLTQRPLTRSGGFNMERTYAEEMDPSMEETDENGEVVHHLTQEQLKLVLHELREWAISWDGRSRNSLCFASTTLSPKMDCLPREWQSPKSVVLLGEMEGKDNNTEMNGRMRSFWDQVERMLRKEEHVTFHFDGQELQVWSHLPPSTFHLAVGIYVFSHPTSVLTSVKYAFTTAREPLFPGGFWV